MRYFVIGADGELYGPADIATLNQWIAEGRLMPTSMLQEELGGARFAASMLKELNFASSQPRNGDALNVGANGENEYKMAWMFSLIGFLCCSYLTPVGVVYAFLAKKKGHPKAGGVIAFSIIMLILAILWGIYFYSIGGLKGLMRQLS